MELIKARANKKGKLVYGVGINDFDTPVVIQGKAIHSYTVWKHMLRRCYSDKYHQSHPTYKGCEVEPFLLSFTNFYNFIRGLKGFGEVDEKGRTFVLDKDLLVKGNKTYGVDTICFVPQELNLFLTTCGRSRGDLPVGVSWSEPDKRYRSQITLFGKVTHLGNYKSVEEAFMAYKLAKEAQAKELAEKWKDKIDQRVYDALMNYTVSVSD
ncbi:HNH homing endonuclease/ putative DNA-binding protein [Acinetobacter phage Mithridates]|nr:HNH homing endonuclease/ putative DNA-binding protein [Acinetobacter phage Mithridates]